MKTRRPSTALAAALAIAACATAATTASGEFTVVEKEKYLDGASFDISCGERRTDTFALPKAAVNVRLQSPAAGEIVPDGFGRDPLATIESVTLRETPAPEIEVTVVGGYKSCEGPGAWRTNGYVVRATYERILHPKVLLSEEPGGLGARQRPKAITATYDSGWKKLRWRSWGDDKAVATGRFYARRNVAFGPGDAGLKTFSYPVKLTLSKVRLCERRYYYTHLETKFLRRPHPEIARQAKVPGVASCLNGG